MPKITLTKPEYKNLCKKANKGFLPVDYFRKSMFNSTFRDSFFLKRKKTIYDDGNTIIKVNRSLNQKHRDLLSILMYEKNTKPEKDGSYRIITSIYQLAKKMGYKNPKDATHIIYNLLDDLANTRVYTRNEKTKLNIDHHLMGYYQYNDEMSHYEIEVPAHTAKYTIFTTGVLIPQDINTKIVQIPNNKSKLKALISFLLSNKKLKNGIGFSSVCDKLDIVKADMKSKFKRQVKDNLDLLQEFQISFTDDKFYLSEEIVEFERAITDKDIEKAKFKEWVQTIKKLHEGQKLCKHSIDKELRTLYIFKGNIHIKSDGKIMKLTENKRVENAIYKNLYLGKVKLAKLKIGEDD